MKNHKKECNAVYIKKIIKKDRYQQHSYITVLHTRISTNTGLIFISLPLTSIPFIQGHLGYPKEGFHLFFVLGYCECVGRLALFLTSPKYLTGTRHWQHFDRVSEPPFRLLLHSYILRLPPSNGSS